MEFSESHCYRLPAPGSCCSTLAGPANAIRARSRLLLLSVLACLLYFMSVASASATDELPDGAGLKRDTIMLLSYQAVAIGALYVMPESISNWSQEQKDDYSIADWWDNVRHPQWDEDEFWLNYLAHPYWGAAYYVRARERHYGRKGAFWYAVAMSTAYEYGAEALFEQPSIQDLLVTPVAGALLGDYFMSLRHGIRARYQPGEAMLFRHRALLGLTDPLGAINRQVRAWLGLREELSLKLYVRRPQAETRLRPARQDSPSGREFGVHFRYRWQ